jgi:hypothetical protein
MELDMQPRLGFWKHARLGAIALAALGGATMCRNTDKSTTEASELALGSHSFKLA